MICPSSLGNFSGAVVKKQWESCFPLQWSLARSLKNSSLSIIIDEAVDQDRETMLLENSKLNMLQDEDEATISNGGREADPCELTEDSEIISAMGGSRPPHVMQTVLMRCL